jgi:hypothetical protein
MQIEGITYQINWAKIKPGTSFFIPCLNASKAKEHILKVTKRLTYRVLAKVVIEEGVRGVRVWREPKNLTLRQGACELLLGTTSGTEGR